MPQLHKHFNVRRNYETISFLIILIKLLSIFFSIAVFSTTSFAQVYKRVELSQDDKKDKNVIARYRVKYEYVTKEVWLYKGGKFRFNVYTDLGESYTTGDWMLKGDTLDLQHEFENKELPIKVLYSNRSLSDTLIRRFAVVKDLNGNELLEAVIHINRDTVACFFGDMDCNHEYTIIDSIKVSVGFGLSSSWFQVDTSKGIIHLLVQSAIDFDRYKPLNFRFKREKGNLRRLEE